MEACMKGIHTGSFSFCEGKRLRKIRLAKRKKVHHGQQTHDSPRCRFLHRAPRQGAHGPEDHGEHEPLVYPRARDHRASVRHLGALVLRRVPASARRGVAFLRRLHHARGGLRLRLRPGGRPRLRHHLGGGPRHPLRRLHRRAHEPARGHRLHRRSCTRRSTP